MKKFLFTVSMVLFVFLLITGCAADPQEGIPTDKTEKLQIGFSADSFVIERWTRDRDVFVSTAEKLGAEVNVQNANGDVEEQISQIEYFIQKKMQVIVIVPIDSKAVTEVLKRAKAEGIATICYDRLVENASADLYISFDNYMVGSFMAQTLVERSPEGGQIFMIQGPLSDHNVALVKQGFLDVIKESTLEIVYTKNCEEWYAEDAYTYAMEGISQYPDVVGIMCGNDDLAGQVYRALSLKQLAGKVGLVGQDGDLSACQRIVEGTQTMTVYKSVDDLAKEAARYAVKLAKGEKIEEKETIDDGRDEIPFHKIEPVPVTIANINDVIISSGFHTKEDVYLNMEK